MGGAGSCEGWRWYDACWTAARRLTSSSRTGMWAYVRFMPACCCSLLLLCALKWKVRVHPKDTKLNARRERIGTTKPYPPNGLHGAEQELCKVTGRVVARKPFARVI
jgi:hypothetical protein